jgi:WW domain-binding protein 4
LLVNIPELKRNLHKIGLIDTETVWEKPKEGFMSLDDYNKLNEQAKDLEEKRKHEEWKYAVDNADELAAKYKREKLKKFRVKDDEEEEKKKKKSEPTKFAVPEEMTSIGKWESVVHE